MHVSITIRVISHPLSNDYNIKMEKYVRHRLIHLHTQINFSFFIISERLITLMISKVHLRIYSQRSNLRVKREVSRADF